MALQGLYSRLLAGQAASDISAQLKESRDYDRADAAYLTAMLHGTIEQQREIEAALEPCLDRPLHGLSPVERAILLLGAWELKNVPDVPYKVVINEAVELAKSFGGTEGHRFVNGVLDKLAKSMRAQAADSV